MMGKILWTYLVVECPLISWFFWEWRIHISLISADNIVHKYECTTKHVLVSQKNFRMGFSILVHCALLSRIAMMSLADSTFSVVSLRLEWPDLNLSWWTTSFSMERLAWALWTIDSSIVFLATRRNITTGRFWPIRWQRSWK